MLGRSRYTSSWEKDSNDPDVLYYNASIVNNTTDDVAGADGYDPPIRFNETRDKAILDDVSQFQFSIVRFVVNGGNKNLPLFIPQIQSYTDQTDVNLTEYGFGMTFEGQNIATSTNINVVPSTGLTYVEWVPENTNPVLAPLPRPTSAVGWAGVWNSGTQYTNGQIVSYAGVGSNYWKAVGSPVIGVNPSYTAGVIFVGSGYWVPASSELGQPQDVSTQYYWCSTYSYWVDLCNTALINANFALYNSSTDLQSQYPAFANFVVDYPNPTISYNPATNLFSINYPPDFNQTPRPGLYTNTKYTNSQRKLYMNINAYGLFSNFNAKFYNYPATNVWVVPVSPAVALPSGFAYRLGVEPVALASNVVASGTYANWLIMTQDYESTSTLWTPVDSIVFTSTLIPTVREDTAPPNTVGSKNVGNSTATALSAFQPIITDISLDLSSDTSGYRKMIYYAPSAEYRMSEFQGAGELRTIDIQVFWKNRLDNNLYPLTMFNLSNVSFKLMFRRKVVPGKGDRLGYT